MESTKEMSRVTFTGGAQEPEKNDCNHFFSAQHLLYCEEAAEGVWPAELLPHSTADADLLAHSRADADISEQVTRYLKQKIRFLHQEIYAVGCK